MAGHLLCMRKAGFEANLGYIVRFLKNKIKPTPLVSPPATGVIAGFCSASLELGEKLQLLRLHFSGLSTWNQLFLLLAFRKNSYKPTWWVGDVAGGLE